MRQSELDARCLLRETAAYWYAEGQIVAWKDPEIAVRNYAHLFGTEQGLAMRQHLLAGTPIGTVPEEWADFLRSVPA